MAFGIPGSTSSADTATFLGRIEYDARVGFWTIVKRVQHSDGSWGDDKGEPFRGPTMIMDMGTLECGFIKFSGGVDFKLVPYGQPYPDQPTDVHVNQEGKQVRSYTPGARVKVAGNIFGDGEAYYWSMNSRTALDAMDELYQQFEQAPEAAMGQIPAVMCSGLRDIKTARSTFKAPVFTIVGWVERLEVFGPRTVPAPAARAHATMTPQAAREMAAASVAAEPAQPVTPAPAAVAAAGASAAKPAAMPF